MGLLSGDGPSLQIVPLDSGTQSIINNQVKNANVSTGEIAAKMNAGVQDAGNQAMQTSDGLNQRAAQTGESSGSLQAIRNQYNKYAGDAVGNVVRSNQANAAMTRANWQNQAARSALAQQQVQTQNYEMMTQAMNAADAARAQVLSSVLGVGGMAAGMYFGGVKSPKAPREAGVASAENETPTGAGKFNESFF